MHLFVDISSHGFGHLAITAPVLNQLATSDPNFRLTIRSALPATKLQQRIKPAFELIVGASDFGYVMIDATRIDLEASATAYRQAHADWAARVADEARFLSCLKPDLALTNVSYLPLAGAAAAGIPALSLCSLNWADLFAHFFGGQAWAKPIHTQMLAAYRSAQAFLRVTPGMAMRALPDRPARAARRSAGSRAGPCGTRDTRPRRARRGRPERARSRRRCAAARCCRGCR